MAQLVSCSEFARSHGITVQRVRQLARAGRIDRAQQVGGRWVMPRSAMLVRRRPGRPAVRGREHERSDRKASVAAMDALLDRRIEERRRLLKAAAAKVLARLRASGATCVTIGSLASGKLRPGSDLDVLVQRHPGKTWAQLDRVASRAAAAFGLEVDLVFAETLAAPQRDRLLEESTR